MLEERGKKGKPSGQKEKFNRIALIQAEEDKKID